MSSDGTVKSVRSGVIVARPNLWQVRLKKETCKLYFDLVSAVTSHDLVLVELQAIHAVALACYVRAANCAVRGSSKLPILSNPGKSLGKERNEPWAQPSAAGDTFLMAR